MRILITCPPMIRSIENFRPLFEEKGVKIHVPSFIQIMSEDELIEILPEFDGWIIGDDPATERVFTAGKQGKLKAVVKWGVGVDNVDFNACKKLGIPVTHTPNMFGNEVADIALAYVLGLARDTYYIDREVRKGNWVKPTGISLAGKKVALVGLGDIGKSIARRLKPFGFSVTGYDPFCKQTAAELEIDQLATFPAGVEQADFVILACALTPSNHHLINETLIASLKNGVRIVNVSRGGLIDEEALVKGLGSGKIKSVALDVFETEPLPRSSELLQFDNCIFGTHNGSHTAEAVSRTSNKAIDSLFAFLNI